MNQLQIDQLNKDIPFNDGKIFWEPNKGYTTKTIKYLFQCGWRAYTSGCVHTLEDMEGKQVLTAYSWPSLLQKTSILMA
jgi:hypothetical protein